jgi:NitT/TauT family transport system substrate-binding protein
MMGEIAKLVAGGKMGYLDPAAYRRTVDELLAGKSDPVISRLPEGAWTHAIWEAAQR